VNFYTVFLRTVRTFVNVEIVTEDVEIGHCSALFPCSGAPVLWLSASPLLYLYNCRTDPNENTNNEEVFSFWSVLRLLPGNNNSVVVFSFWSVPRKAGR
jgi:hypothetical protein